MPSPAAPEFDALFLEFQAAVAGRYSIEREIGRGGSGVVYLAREVHLDRPVAIKLLPPERAAQERLRERFIREARLAARLSHPNIIPIHSVEDANGFVFFVMAYVDGDTLAQRVRLRGPLPATEGTRVLRDVAWALAYAHGEGVVHRDVKPDNILLERATGRVLVADFGIAAAVGDASEDGVSGTPEFMSPEQALARDVDERSDVYSLGATAFYAFSGRLPFEGATATEVLAKHVTEPPRSLESFGLSVPRKVAHLVDRCLAKEPDQRPAGAAAVGERLGVALEQRREVPAALRAFVNDRARFGIGLFLVYPITLISVSALIGQSTGHAGWAWIGFAAGMAAAPLVHFVDAARALTLQGFAHVDIGPAFAAAIEDANEERAAEAAKGPSFLERVAGRVAAVSGAVALGALAAAITSSVLKPGTTQMAIFWLSQAFALSGAVSIVTLIPKLLLLQRRSDVDTAFWRRLWMGSAGKLAFRVARRLIGRRAVGSAMTHRATELSLGLAAEQLYEALPRETRTALGDLPSTLRRLQDDAQRLRARHDAVQEALNDAGGMAAGGAYGELRNLRDSLHGRLRDAVGSLETIRLNLLRLHAGTGSVEGLTTHIEYAAAVSEEVARLLAARAEVDDILAYPSETAPTPV